MKKTAWEILEKFEDDIRMLDFEYNDSEAMSSETYEQERNKKLISVLSDLSELVMGEKLDMTIGLLMTREEVEAYNLAIARISKLILTRRRNENVN